MAEKTVKTRIQLIRRNQADLESKNPTTLRGEFYIVEDNDDTSKYRIKIGATNVKFNDLPYYEAALLEHLGIVIDKTAIGTNQILTYTGTNWENKPFADTVSVVYDTEKGLHLNHFFDDDVPNGYMPVKDTAAGGQGLKWVKPVDASELQEYVEQARLSAVAAATSATEAQTHANNAAASAQLAEREVEVIPEFLQDKFWKGTAEEYNALEVIDEGTIYFVKV